MILPIADPHAAAGPNIREHIMGMTLAGRTSVNPGTSGMATLKGISTAAYTAAVTDVRTIILVFFHIVISSFIDYLLPLVEDSSLKFPHDALMLP
jgi:hypothetical protein